MSFFAFSLRNTTDHNCFSRSLGLSEKKMNNNYFLFLCVRSTLGSDRNSGRLFSFRQRVCGSFFCSKWRRIKFKLRTEGMTVETTRGNCSLFSRCFYFCVWESALSLFSISQPWHWYPRFLVTLCCEISSMEARDKTCFFRYHASSSPSSLVCIWLSFLFAPLENVRNFTAALSPTIFFCGKCMHVGVCANWAPCVSVLF